MRLKTIIGLAYAGEVFALLQLRSTPAERHQRLFELFCPASTVASWSTSTAAIHLLDVLPMPLLSMCLGLAGGALRLWCYRTLGNLFTYEAAMSDDHVLVTRGPYSVVRHPSYTGVAMIVLGKALEFFCPRSYVRECGVADTWVVWALYTFVATTLYIVYSLFARIPVEDAQFKAQFGKEWEVYRRAVPYKLVPLLI